MNQVKQQQHIQREEEKDAMRPSISAMATLKMAKNELRKAIRHKLSSIPQDSLSSQSSQVTSTLLSLREYREARTISIYLSMPVGEAATAEIVIDALQQGKKVFVPYLYKSGDPSPKSMMEKLSLFSEDDYRSLKLDKWGIPSLDSKSIDRRNNCYGGYGIHDGSESHNEKLGLDLIVMPGVGFDTSGRRLGHGRGYYDSFLSRYHRYTSQAHNSDGYIHNKPFLVGLTLKEQLLPEQHSIPVNNDDWPLHALVVGDGRVIRPARSDGARNEEKP
ncbi:MAG: hypothetical protein M1834_004002 [Cirrosporium novae-zelandiae]|nr:MAG: hypothetical protein M1834_004002 [Cirrosporium novae-zelandiae]